MDRKLCQFREFFSGRSILLTGGTGFMGMALIEGLLSACEDIGRIYVIVREKKGFSPSERVAKLLSSEIFNHVLAEAKAKVIPLVGNLTCENFDFDEKTLIKIREEVSVFYHNAGLIKFNRSLKEAIEMNVLTTFRAVELAKTLPRLSAFIYSSTILANINKSGKIYERIYSTKSNPLEMIRLAKEEPDKVDKVFGGKDTIMEGHFVSYTYSKHLAENLIAQEMVGYPVGIIRPALVYGFYDHEIPGWMGSSKSGHCGLIKAFTKGAARSYFTTPNRICYSIPCDLVIHSMMALSVSLGTSKPPEKPTILHLCNTRNMNPMTMQKFVDILNEEAWKNPCDSYVFLPRMKIRTGLRSDFHMFFLFLVILMLYIPEQLFNLSTKSLSGMGILKLQYNASKIFNLIGEGVDDISIDNTQALTRSLHPFDQKKYSFDIRKVDWNILFRYHIAWIRKSVYKDSSSVTWMHRVLQYGYLAIEAASYFSIFIGTFLVILNIGSNHGYSLLTTCVSGLSLGLGLAGFFIWI
ncbi:hypothetical protein DMENIID0001_162830 [Sergentomyia squamirostris]